MTSTKILSIIIIVLLWSSDSVMAQVSTGTDNVRSDRASRLNFSINLGMNVTFVPDSWHTLIALPDGLVVPNYIHPANGNTILISESVVPSKTKAGWYGALEFGYALNHNFAWHFSAGFTKINFDYQTTFYDASGQHYPEPVELDELDSDFGNTSLSYLTLSPSISKTFNKFRVQAGPTLNWLLDDEFNNVLAIYRTPPDDENNNPDEVFFDATGRFKSFVWGVKLGVSYTVFAPVDVSVSGEYTLSSLYEDSALFETGDSDTVKPFSLQFGIMVRPFEF